MEVPQAASSTLSARDVAKTFGRRLLFRSLTFSVGAGSSLAVTGANGSGKSTLLRILAGVLTPTKGEVRLQIDGAVVEREEHPLNVGLVAPYLNVYDGFSPEENLRFIARARSIDNARARIDEMLERVSLAERAGDLVATFSSGMKQRVKFAAALLADPVVLLLDEPSVNLDAAGLEMVEEIVDGHVAGGGIVIVATNDTAEAARHSSRLRIEDFR